MPPPLPTPSLPPCLPGPSPPSYPLAPPGGKHPITNSKWGGGGGGAGSVDVLEVVGGDDAEVGVGALEVGGEVPEVADEAAAVGGTAAAGHFEVVLVHRGGVVEGEFFVGRDVAEGDEGDVVGGLDDHAAVGGAGVVDVVVHVARRAEVEVGGDLEGRADAPAVLPEQRAVTAMTTASRGSSSRCQPPVVRDSRNGHDMTKLLPLPKDRNTRLRVRRHTGLPPLHRGGAKPYSNPDCWNREKNARKAPCIAE